MGTKKRDSNKDKQIIQILIKKIQKLVKDEKSGAKKAAHIISEMIK